MTLTLGLDNDEGVPSDDEEEEEAGEEKEEEKVEEKEEKQDSPEKAKAAPAPFVFGAPTPKLVGSDDPNKTFGFGTGAGFSFGNVGGTNIFAKKDGGKTYFDVEGWEGGSITAFTSNVRSLHQTCLRLRILPVNIVLKYQFYLVSQPR